MTQKITVEIDWVSFEGWQEVKVFKSLEDFCGSFSIKLSRSEDLVFPIKIRSSCIIKIEGKRIITGFVEKIEVEYGVDKHNITVSGRDRTMDVNDSTVAIPAISAPFTLVTVAAKVLKFLQIASIRVTDNRWGRHRFEQDNSDATSLYGMTGFEFIEFYAKKQQVLVTTTPFGDILFTQPSTKKLKTILTLKRGAEASILTSKVTYDDSKRFYLYEATGQAQIAGDLFSQKKQEDTNNIININSEVRDRDIRVGRTMVFVAKDSTQGSKGTVDMTAKVKWEANFRRSQSFIYNCTVRGFKPQDDDDIWMPNKLVTVDDEFCKINGLDLLIVGVNYSYDLEGGAKTSLKLMDKDSFTLKVTKPKKEKVAQSAGGDLFKDPPTQHGDAALDFARKLQEEEGT